ncbi:MAG: asparagine synthase-related protein [Sphingomonas sp.]
MSARYIAVVGHECDAMRCALQRVPGLAIALDLPRLLLVCDTGTDRTDLGGGRGTIIGTLFGRQTGRRASRLTESEIDACHHSGGASLIEHYWGSYVAFLADERGGLAIVRDPSGAAACYVSQSPNAHVVTSDVRVCASLGLIRSEIDWQGVAAHLLWPDRRTRRTCIAGVRELMPGCRLTVGNEPAGIDRVWAPWSFTSRDRRIDDPRKAAEAVRDAVVDAVGAWSKRYSRPLVSLSGGLDSSIVAACMTSGVAAVTLATHERLGDERQYARAVAERQEVDLIEREMTIEAIDPRRSNAASLPRPVSRLFAQAFDQIWAETVVMTGAEALFHGGGGDNVFCFLTSSTPYLDAVVDGQSRHVRHAVLDSLSRMTQVSRWQIRRAALRKILVDRGRFRWRQNPRLLTQVAIAGAGRPESHPWFETIPAGTLPGKRAHVAGLVGIQNYLEAVVPAQKVPVIAPLMSQPVIETCLRIPTWLWCRDGMNRMVARAAFRSRLPAEVIDRRGKGSPGAFDARTVTAKRQAIREMLRDGHLAAQGLIDLDAVDQALGRQGPLHGDGYLRVTGLVDVESWVQSWIGASPSTTRGQS